MWAAGNGHLAVVQELLQAGVNKEEKDKVSTTITHTIIINTLYYKNIILLLLLLLCVW